MTDKELKEYCYKLYRFDWMRSHGYDIEDIIKQLEIIYHDTWDDEDRNPENLYKEFEEEFGFSGSLWVCFDEFCNAEFLDADYVDYLLSSQFLNHHDTDAWLTYMRHYMKE